MNTKKTTKKRTCLLVLGMHRSGTSALTRVLSLAGAALPKRLMGASEGNEKGHWESLALAEYHDKMLAELGSSWYDWRALDMGLLPIKRRDEIGKEIRDIIKQDYDDAPLFVLKDPRICRFAPFFLEALNEIDVEVKTILPIRNPLEVCLSLEKRDGMSRADAALLWLRHVLDAEKATRGVKRAIITYNHLLDDWKAEFKKISGQLELEGIHAIDEIGPQVEEFISSNHRHQTARTEDVLLDPLLRDWAGGTYKALLVLAQNPESEKAMARLDKIASEFNNASPILHRLYGEVRNERESEVGDLKTALSEAENKVAELTATLGEKVDEAEQIKATLSTAEGNLAELEKRLSQAEGESGQLEATLAQRGAEIGELKQELADKEAQSEDIKVDLNNAMKQSANLEAKLSERNEAVAELTEAMTSQRRQTTGVKSALTKQKNKTSRLEEMLSEAKRRATQRDSEINSLNTSLSEAEGRAAQITALLAEEEERRRALEEEFAQEKQTLSQTFEEKKTALEAEQGKAAELEGQLTTSRQEAGRIAESASHAQKTIEEYRNSTSWKVTRPLRAVGKTINGIKKTPSRIKNVSKTIASGISHAGGLRPTISKASRILRQEGIASLRSAFLHFHNNTPHSDINFKNIKKAVKKHTSNHTDIDNMALRHEILNSGLWDEKWYLSTYCEDYNEHKKTRPEGMVLSPLDYYIQEGWKLGHEPSKLLPVQINQRLVGRNKVDYFLNTLRFNGYHFDKNIWIPSQETITTYLETKRKRKTKNVIYTCILDNYDSLMQPYFIARDWDYVCFTDNPDLLDKEMDGVWKIRPVMNKRATSTKTNRWHKMHPHFLFPKYERSIYIDGNINIISNNIFGEIIKHNRSILLPKHFKRNCTFQEIEALLKVHSHRLRGNDKALLVALRKLIEQDGFPKEFGLSENNLIYRVHHDEAIVKLSEDWWKIYDVYASRDQVTLPYVFWKNGMVLQEYLFTNCRINYKDFWLVRHISLKKKHDKYRKTPPLRPTFKHNNIAVVFSTNTQYIPYLGVAIYSLIKNSNPDYNYDIIILVSNISMTQLEKVCNLASSKPNISIRIFDTSSLIQTLPDNLLHVEGYVPTETYNKCFITEILSGYDRCVYLDSDILVLDDIQKLHNIDLEGNAIGASVNVANVNAAYCQKVIKGKKFDEYLKHDLGITNHNYYFQAGVIVLDMEKLRTMKLREQTIDTLKKLEKPIFFDQCIFNSIFNGDVCFFSTSWNHVWYMQQYSYLRGSVPDDIFFDYARGRVVPKIIHYAGKDKPQNRLGWALADNFWKYAYASPFLKDIRKDIVAKNNEVATVMSGASDYEWSRVKPRLLVHVHLYYIDQLDVMTNALRNISDCNYELFVTMVKKNKEVERRILSEWKDAKILVLPNVGYDAYPFLHVLKQVRLSNFEFILKIHTKNARRSGQDDVYGIKVPDYQWRDELLDAIVGSKKVFRKNIARFLEDKKLGCIGAEEFIFSTQENREEKTYRLAEWRKKCGVVGGTHYLGGAMFLARAYPFERLKGLNMQPKDFKSQQMGTKDYQNLAHIFERLFGIVIENEGFYISGHNRRN